MEKRIKGKKEEEEKSNESSVGNLVIDKLESSLWGYKIMTPDSPAISEDGEIIIT